MHSIKTPNGEAKEDSSQEKNKRGISSGSIRNADGDPSTTLASNNKVARFSKKSKRQFALREPVEQVRDLIAQHNLTEDKLLRVLKLGGFPMPSIAVTNLDHSNFGNISVLFGKETIDAGEKPYYGLKMPYSITEKRARFSILPSSPPRRPCAELPACYLI